LIAPEAALSSSVFFIIPVESFSGAAPLCRHADVRVVFDFGAREMPRKCLYRGVGCPRFGQLSNGLVMEIVESQPLPALVDRQHGPFPGLFDVSTRLTSQFCGLIARPLCSRFVQRTPSFTPRLLRTGWIDL
jgi:hypothetical protein